jgi:hypothetical protein
MNNVFDSHEELDETRLAGATMIVHIQPAALTGATPPKDLQAAADYWFRRFLDTMHVFRMP